jgi:very-long-chain (3R)-3-hydroxyacyl-CoA dehydratase
VANRESIGIVRSPVATTALQVASRVVLIWGIVENFPVETNLAYTTMLLAWSVTEVVRYSYFVLSLTGQVPPFLIWLRYNLFFVLYPLGIGSEVWLVWSSIPAAFAKDPKLGFLLYAIVAIYVPGKFSSFPGRFTRVSMLTLLVIGSYVLYTHMMAQRRRVLRGKARARD